MEFSEENKQETGVVMVPFTETMKTERSRGRRSRVPVPMYHPEMSSGWSDTRVYCSEERSGLEVEKASC